MRALLLLALLALSARAQEVFPDDIKDPSLLRNMEFLYQEQRAYSQSATVDVNKEFKSVVTFSGGTGGTIHASTRTVLTAVATRAGNLGPAVSGSTITLTLAAAGPVDLIFNGPCRSDNIGGTVAWLTALVDGAFPSSFYSSTMPVLAIDENVTTHHPCGFYLRVDGLAAGAHDFALSIGSNGTAQMRLECATAPCQWEAREAR